MGTVKTSGSLSLNEIHIAAGGTSGTQCSMNDSDIRSLRAAAGKSISNVSQAQRGFFDFFGASSSAEFTIGYHSASASYPHRGISLRTDMVYTFPGPTPPFGSQPTGGQFGVNGAFGFTNVRIEGWAYQAFPASGTPRINLYWLRGHPFTDPVSAGATGMTVTGPNGSYSWTFASKTGSGTSYNNLNDYYYWESQTTNWSNVKSSGAPVSGETYYLELY